MPKLNKDSLEKRFTCQYCESTFRTRQGLSGHIQWKHKARQTLSVTDISNVIQKAKHLDSNLKKGGILLSTEKARIVARWASIMTMCEILKIKINNQDFKNYIIASLARMYEYEELSEKLTNIFRNLLEEYK